MNQPSRIFADVLRACREEINAQFALMRKEFPSLDAEAYFAFLRDSGDCVVSAVAAADGAAAVETGRAVCEAGLELVARNLAGQKARRPWLDDAWKRVLTAAATVVAGDPRRVIGAVSNAVHQLASTTGARPEQWISLMEKVAPISGDASLFLRAGQVAAWRSGLAYYRDGALAVAADLPERLALAALGAEGGIATLLTQLRADAWFDPAAPRNGVRLVSQAGAFRGFGGLFAVPPVIAFRDGHWLASSGEEHWLLTADAFGATFHRVVGQKFPPSAAPERSAIAKVPVPPDFGEVTSLAVNGSTTAVTTTLTHAVLFFHTES